MTEQCDCDICERTRRVMAALDSGDMIKIRPAVSQLLNDLMNAETDVSYYECIMDGSWTGAVPILERALCRAKKLAGLEHDVEPVGPETPASSAT